MIAVDTNVLVHAHRRDSAFHEPARQCLSSLARGSRRWGVPWSCVHEFVGVVTHARIWKDPTALPLALAVCRSWTLSPHFSFLGEGPSYLEALEQLAVPGAITGPRIHDARIAAVCLQNGVRELWTADRDFSRFAALRTRNPLVAL